MSWLDRQSEADYVRYLRIILGAWWWSITTLVALGMNNGPVEWRWAYIRIIFAAFFTLCYCKYGRLLIHASMKARRIRLNEERRRT